MLPQVRENADDFLAHKRRALLRPLAGRAAAGGGRAGDDGGGPERGRGPRLRRGGDQPRLAASRGGPGSREPGGGGLLPGARDAPGSGLLSVHVPAPRVVLPPVSRLLPEAGEELGLGLGARRNDE